MVVLVGRYVHLVEVFSSSSFPGVELTLGEQIVVLVELADCTLALGGFLQQLVVLVVLLGVAGLVGVRVADFGLVLQQLFEFLQLAVGFDR